MSRRYAIGSKGADVELIQRTLNSKLGLSLDPDGQYGPGTKAAVIQFQRENGLSPDGVVGEGTWDALGLNEPILPEITIPEPSESVIEPPTLPSPVIETPTLPSPVIETPKQTQQRRLRQRQKDQAQKEAIEKVSINTSNVELPKDVQPSGQDKLNQLTVKKAVSFVAANLVVIDQVLKSLGLPNSQDLRDLQTRGEQAVEDFIQNQTCANQETLKEAVRIRNEVNEQLGRLGQSYNLTNQALNRLSDFVSGQITASNFLKSVRAITSQASKAIPTPPGVPGIIPATLSDVSTVVDVLVFTALGEPKLKKAKATVDNGLMFLSMSSQTLRKVLEPLSVLDRVLIKCGQTISPTPESITQLQQLNQTTENSNNSNYKGFTLEIIEEPFSNTVTRRKAVAKNAQGIILVETPLSFTTIEQVLLDQVKFTIDSQNLKPN